MYLIIFGQLGQWRIFFFSFLQLDINTQGASSLYDFSYYSMGVV